jgi:hypothetical protein
MRVVCDAIRRGNIGPVRPGYGDYRAFFHGGSVSCGTLFGDNIGAVRQSRVLVVCEIDFYSDDCVESSPPPKAISRLRLCGSPGAHTMSMNVRHHVKHLQPRVLQRQFQILRDLVIGRMETRCTLRSSVAPQLVYREYIHG